MAAPASGGGVGSGAGRSAKPAAAGPSGQASETSLKRKRGLFSKDLRLMMYGFGDDPDPMPETVLLMEDILLDYITDMLVEWFSIRHGANSCFNKHGPVSTVYIFGDTKSGESVDFTCNISMKIHKAQEVASRRGKLTTEDIMFLVRKDSRKFTRVKELLAMNEELKRARKAFDVDEEKFANED